MSVPPPLPVHNPYAAPESPVELAPGETLELADRLTRLGAAILDSLVVAVPVMIIAGLAAMLSPAQGGDDAAFAAIGIGALVVIVAVVVINLVWLHRYGQTIGKRLLRIRILRSDGSHCSVARVIFARWLPVTLLGAIPLLGYVVTLVDPLMIFRQDRRCLHDLIADTIVVSA